eukprot:5038391-Heterocapsa_arctica.AAC.1
MRMNNTLEYPVKQQVKIRAEQLFVEAQILKKAQHVAAEQKRARKKDKEKQTQDNQTKVKKSSTDKVHSDEKGKIVQLTCIDSVKQEADIINKHKRSSDNEQQNEPGKAKITKNEHVHMEQQAESSQSDKDKLYKFLLILQEKSNNKKSQNKLGK